MTKKTDTKAKVKGADAEKKVVKKIQEGNQAAKTKKFDSKKLKENKDAAGSATTAGAKRTWENKNGDVKPKASGDKKDSQQPVLNRRQKQKVSDLIKKLRISYNRLLMKKKEMSGEEKHAIVQECIDAIGEKYPELCYKHDGCRVLQALVKFGNRPQRILVVDKLKD